MRKAKVAAIVCGMIASCLFGGFAVVEAATITLDDSTADLVVYVEPTTETTTAATVTSIETTTAAETRNSTVKDAVETTTARDTKETWSQTTTVTAVTTTAVTAEDEDAETRATIVTAIAIVKNAPAKEAVQTTTTAKATTAKATTTTTTTTKATTTTTTTTTTAATTKAAPATTKATTEDMTNPPMPTDVAVEVIVPETEAPTTYVELETEFIAEANANAEIVAPDSNAVSVSEADYILLCNAVAHEAGANSISATEKAKVVEVIMNRVASSNYPDTVYGVLTQKYQFSGSSSYVNLGTYSSKVTDLVKEAVDLYLSDPTQFSEGYLSFTGDGVRNYFR